MNHKIISHNFRNKTHTKRIEIERQNKLCEEEGSGPCVVRQATDAEKISYKIKEKKEDG